MTKKEREKIRNEVANMRRWLSWVDNKLAWLECELGRPEDFKRIVRILKVTG